MHPNPIYHTGTDAQNLAFARDRAFGVLTVNGADRPLLAHVPFLLSGDGKTADLHLMRSNPVARAAKEPVSAVLAVSGGDGYISPDWYGIENQVPTWNYVAVHLTGRLEVLAEDQLRAVLDRQSAEYEQRLRPKTPWTADKMESDAMGRLMRMIVPCRMHVTGVDGTWKLGQNKPEAARMGAAAGVDEARIGAETAALAALMRRG